MTSENLDIYYFLPTSLFCLFVSLYMLIIYCWYESSIERFQVLKLKLLFYISMLTFVSSFVSFISALLE